MTTKIKYGKISIVVFLTALIWVWADLAQDEQMELTGVVVQIAKPSDPALWVNFVVERRTPDLQTSVPLDAVMLKGPASRVAEVTRLKKKGALDLNLFLAPEKEGLTQEGVSTRDVLTLLKGSDEIRKLGLTVESCEPRTLTIRTRQLVKATVPVECVGLDPSLQVDMEPAQVEAFVPAEEAQALKATVSLNAAEQEQAKNVAVEKTPYLELLPGQRRELVTPVKIRLAPKENVLQERPVLPATLGFCFSQNVQGKFQVVLSNDPPPPTMVLVRATLQAYQAYQALPYQMVLNIHDADRQSTEPWITRQVTFPFPEDYVARGEIKAANQQAPVVKFRLEPVGEPGPGKELSTTAASGL
jgi:hypothetical protein